MNESNENELTLVERVERCEDGLKAIETILRCAFPQFFEQPTGANDNGDTKAISGAEKGPGETGEETSDEEKARAETSEVKE